MAVLWVILSFVAMVAILIALLMLCKKFVFPKIPVNKYVPLGIAIAGFIFQLIVKIANVWLNFGLTILIVIFFAWYLDIAQTGGYKKEKKIVMKPKAKPNRVKNKNKK